MMLDEIRSILEAVERNAALYDEARFAERLDALDTLAFDVCDPLDARWAAGRVEEPAALRERAERLRRRLEQVDARLFRRLRAQVRAGTLRGDALRHEIDRIAGFTSASSPDSERRGFLGGSRPSEIEERGQEAGAGGTYDILDAFVVRLLALDAPPAETYTREPEMVFYEPAPARIILEFVENAGITRRDVFYDLGSGLGQVCLLVSLLTGARANGVEVEPAYCEVARRRAADLGLAGVEFLAADARGVDTSDGTVFFMFTPFRGRMLQDVLEKLERETRGHTIRLGTYGPCTPEVAQQGWLERLDGNQDELYRLAVFRSGAR